MEGYKAFNAGWVCRDFQYEIGKTYELPEGQKLKICECGFHFCKNPIDVFGYYPMNDSVLIAKVEALGEIQQEGTKYCTDKIKIVREFTREELQALILNGSYNTGDYNTGGYNTGDCNSGNRNTGHYNSGHGNSGHGNSGDYNSGDDNSGGRNSGNYNSGAYNAGCGNSGNRNAGNTNSGDYNSGHYNSGDYNVGNYNVGHYNAGHYNSGDGNSGNCNSGNYNAGMFNTDEPYMRAFNKDTTILYSDFVESLDYNFYGLCFRIAAKKLIDGDEEKIKALPNFDAEIFKEITGIDIVERREE